MKPPTPRSCSTPTAARSSCRQVRSRLGTLPGGSMKNAVEIDIMSKMTDYQFYVNRRNPMMGRLKLAYVVLEQRDPRAWDSFLDQLLDASARERAKRYLRVQAGRSDDIAAIGFDLADARARED